MDIRSRILKGRLIEKMHRDPAYSSALGLDDCSGFRLGPAGPQPSDEVKKETAPDAEETSVCPAQSTALTCDREKEVFST